MDLNDPSGWRLRAVEIQLIANTCTDAEIGELLSSLIAQFELLAVVVEKKALNDGSLQPEP